MKRWAVAALALVVLGALWLSGSSTISLGVAHGIPDLALPALVVVLEVASVIGTALWVTGETGQRKKPAVVVVLASTVAAIGGWQAYGWLGLAGPVAVVLVTDMVAERWQDLTAATTSQSPVVPSQSPATDLHQSEPGAGLDRSRSGAGDERRLTPVVDELDRVRAIVAQGGGRGTVAEQLGITPRQARTLIDRVKAEAAA